MGGSFPFSFSCCPPARGAGRVCRLSDNDCNAFKWFSVLHATGEQPGNEILPRVRGLIMHLGRPEWKIPGFKSDVGNESLQQCWEIRWCQTCVWVLRCACGGGTAPVEQEWGSGDLRGHINMGVGTCRGGIFLCQCQLAQLSVLHATGEIKASGSAYFIKKPYTLVVLQFRKWNSYSSISNSVL